MIELGEKPMKHDNQWLTHGSGEKGGLTHGCRWYCDAEA